MYNNYKNKTNCTEKKVLLSNNSTNKLVVNITKGKEFNIRYHSRTKIILNIEAFKINVQ